MPVCIQGVPGGNANTVSPYTCTSTANYWNNGSSKAFTLNTATVGENIRYSTSGADVDCTQPCIGNATCTECTSPAADNGTCVTPAVPPFTLIKAVGCQAGVAGGPLRQLTDADPTSIVLLAPASPPAGTYFDDLAITLTSAPPQPDPPVVVGANDVHICFTTNGATPT